MNRTRPTIDQVAAAAGVSKATVSKALNHPETSEISPETVRRVQAAAQRLGYRPRTAGAAAAQRRIGLISERGAPASHGAFAGALEALMVAAVARRFQVQLLPALQGLEQLEADLAGGRIDGVIVADPMPAGCDALLARGRLPAVLLNQYSPLPLSQVRPDDALLMRRLLQHLLELGHRRIAYAQWDRHGYHPSEAVRQQAYLAACAEAGLRPQLVIGPREGLAAGLLGSSAAIVYNSDDALHLLRDLERDGRRVPQDLSLACFDDTSEGQLVSPALTCVTVPGREMAERAVALLEAQFAGERAARLELVEGALVVRASTAPAV